MNYSLSQHQNNCHTFDSKYYGNRNNKTAVLYKRTACYSIETFDMIHSVIFR